MVLKIFLSSDYSENFQSPKLTEKLAKSWRDLETFESLQVFEVFSKSLQDFANFPVRTSEKT
jgi:hypothetical protein